MESIVATTKTAAECMGIGDEIGTVEPGKVADLILVSENPLERIHVVEDERNIRFVMKDGKIIKKLF